MMYGRMKWVNLALPHTCGHMPMSSTHKMLISAFHSGSHSKGLPTIDISPFTSPTISSSVERSHCVETLSAACREVGFFYLVGHGVSEEDRTKVLEQANCFFQQPATKKERLGMQNSKYPEACRGYQRLRENITQGEQDYHEALDLFAELPPEHHLRRGLSSPGANPVDPVRAAMLQAQNTWPDHPTGLTENLKTYIQRMQGIGNIVMRIMALGLGLPEDHFVSKYISDPFWVMRLIYYPVGDIGEKEEATKDHIIGCGEHTDYGCLTIVNQDQTQGALQVRPVGTQDWINVDPVAGAFVINIGDMVSKWTAGLYSSTPHRVLVRSDQRTPRVSIPYFHEPNFDAWIEPQLQSQVVHAHLQKLRSGLLPSVPDDLLRPIQYGDHVASKISTNFTIAKS